MSKCKLCQISTKNWEGDDRQCAFESGIFSNDNWNCATVNKIREVAIASRVWHEDQHFAFVLHPHSVRALAVSWYKSRGRTEDIVEMPSDDLRREITEAVCLEYLNQSNN